jgi:hypothetical protein
MYTEIETRFTRWYQYEIEIPAKGTIINTVTAPIYPSINANWEPSIYGYTYLTSPAKTWKKFGNLDIEINTPYYLINDENGFTKTETGYELSLDGLPEGEVKFTLSTDVNAKKPSQIGGCISGCGYMFLLMGSDLMRSMGCRAVVGVCITYMPIVLTAGILLFKKRK